MEALIEIRLITINKQATEENHVEDFVELLRANHKLPPITVRQISPNEYCLVDGRHRLEARKRLGEAQIWVRVTL